MSSNPLVCKDRYPGESVHFSLRSEVERGLFLEIRMAAPRGDDSAVPNTGCWRFLSEARDLPYTNIRLPERNSEGKIVPVFGAGNELFVS
jgi:hypothetical protein